MNLLSTYETPVKQIKLTEKTEENLSQEKVCYRLTEEFETQ